MFTTPTVVGDLLYAGSCSGVFFAFAADDGEVVWRYDTRDDGDPAQFHGNPVMTDSLVVTPSDGTAEGNTYAFELATGKLVWKQPTDGGGGITTDLLAVGWSALGVTLRGDLVSFGLADGFPLWSFSPEGERLAEERAPNPALAGDRVLFGGLDGAVYAVDAHEGTKIWKIDLGVRISTALTVHGDSVYLGLEDARVLRVAVDDGSVTGEMAVDAAPTGYPLAAGDTLVVLLASGSEALDLLALDSALEGERWRRSSADDWTTVRPYSWRGRVLAGTTAGALHAFALEDGSVDWRTELEGRLRGLGSAGDRLYIGTIEGALYALEMIVQDGRTGPASSESARGDPPPSGTDG